MRFLMRTTRFSFSSGGSAQLRGDGDGLVGAVSGRPDDVTVLLLFRCFFFSLFLRFIVARVLIFFPFFLSVDDKKKVFGRRAQFRSLNSFF